MNVLFDSFGSFHTGRTSFRRLISKKSRGIITLTEDTFSFESQKDKILFKLKLSQIQDFFMKKRFLIPIVEVISVHGTKYTLFTLRKHKILFHSSLPRTEALFRQLTRLIYNKDQIILFDAIVTLYPGSIKNLNLKESLLQGHIFLTENYILFKAFQTGKLNHIKILQIEQIIMEMIDSITYVSIETQEGNIYSILPLKIAWGTFIKDETKTEKLYDVLNQTMIYKQSEQIKKGKNKKIIEDGFKCMYCGNQLKPGIDLCPYCGNRNEAK